MKCDKCEISCDTMEIETKNPLQIPYIAHEQAQARNERKDKRNLIIIIILILSLLFSNMAWLWVFNQYDYSSTTTTYTTDAEDGGNAIINDSGEVTIDGEGN